MEDVVKSSQSFGVLLPAHNAKAVKRSAVLSPQQENIAPSNIIDNLGLSPLKRKKDEGLESSSVKTVIVSPSNLSLKASSNSSIKAKRVKKLASQLPESTSIEDILHIQEENKEKSIVIKELENKNDELNKKLNSYESEMSLLKSEHSRKLTELQQEQENEIQRLQQSHQQQIEEIFTGQKSLENMLEIEQKSKESILLELANKTQQNYDKEKLAMELQEQTKIYQENISKMECTLTSLKQKFFFSCALALKFSLQDEMNRHNQPHHRNSNQVDLNKLYEEILKENIPTEQWHVWLLSKIN